MNRKRDELTSKQKMRERDEPTNQQNKRDEQTSQQKKKSVR